MSVEFLELRRLNKDKMKIVPSPIKTVFYLWFWADARVSRDRDLIGNSFPRTMGKNDFWESKYCNLLWLQTALVSLVHSSPIRHINGRGPIIAIYIHSSSKETQLVESCIFFFGEECRSVVVWLIFILVLFSNPFLRMFMTLDY